jgi:diacylglycerol kinase (ATP)
MLEVFNGVTGGGGMKLAPAAHPGDGLLDAVLLRALSLPRFLVLVPRAIEGRNLGHPSVRITRVRRLRVESLDGAPLLFHADGEVRRAESGACTLELEPGALPIIRA